MKNGWPIKRLAEVAESISTGPFGTMLHKCDYVPDGIPLVNPMNIVDSRIVPSAKMMINEETRQRLSTYVLRTGDVVVGRRGELGRCAIVTETEDGWLCGTGSCFIRLSKQVDERFFVMLFGSSRFKSLLESSSVGSTMSNLNHGILYSLPVPVPPLTEQRRIVGILDQAFAGVATAKANAEKNLRNARALFESYLNAIFTKRGEGWVERQLASLCHEITVGHVGPMKTQYKECGVPFLRSQNIRPFEVSMENAMFIDEAFHLALKKSQLRPGDLAIVRTGYPGTAAVIPAELRDSNCSDLVIVRPGREVNPHFLAAFFNSAFGKQLVLGKIVGAAQKHFNITAAKEVMLHVPPIPEQRSTISRIDELRAETQRLETIYRRKLAALEELKKSLLDRAFSGQL